MIKKVAIIGIILVMLVMNVSARDSDDSDGPSPHSGSPDPSPTSYGDFGQYLTLKWEVKPFSHAGHFHPCMADIDNDGTEEIVYNYGGTITVLNGKTGGVEWTKTGGGGCMLELADLDGDGYPEILHCVGGCKIRALDDDGSVIWLSNSVPGGQFPGTAIVSGDTNNDGLPEIYVVTLDLTSPYTACITKLDHNGVQTAWSDICYKPCWGGLALADADFDGDYEVYLGDRASRGGPGGSGTSYPSNPARGLSCYDADDLSLMWYRADLYHSTPCPALIDVTGDGKLEVIGNNIINNGACVVDAQTGEDIYNWKGSRINNHAKGTLWDFDQDGHIELISCCGYGSSLDGYGSSPSEFTILDLVTGEIEFRSNTGEWITYPPTGGDVTGDGILEILCATSTEEGHGTVGAGQVLIYDQDYNVIQHITGYPYGQLWEPYCVDCDGDGLNEVIIGSRRGHIWCYDTPGDTPWPKPQCWSGHYNTYRSGVYVYIPPLGTNPAVIFITTNIQIIGIACVAAVGTVSVYIIGKRLILSLV